MGNVYGKVVITLTVPNFIADDDRKQRYSKRIIFVQHCEGHEAATLASKFHSLTGGRYRTDGQTQFIPNPVDL